MAVFSQNMDQLTGDPKADIQMMYDYIIYMTEEIDRAHSDSVKASEAINKAMTLAAKELTRNG